MKKNPSYRIRLCITAVVAAFLWMCPLTATADTLSLNLSNPTAGTEAASATRWLTASFGTGSTTYNLDEVTLLLANTSAGQARVGIYTDGRLEPGSLLGLLVAPSSYSSSLAQTTFTANGITLAPNSTYWVVLSAASGGFNWAWTTTNTGTGVGYQNTWGESDDAGANWYTYDIYPTQMSVSATALTTSQPVPEPGAILLLATGVTIGAGLLRRHHRRKNSD